LANNGNQTGFHVILGTDNAKSACCDCRRDDGRAAFEFARNMTNVRLNCWLEHARISRHMFDRGPDALHQCIHARVDRGAMQYGVDSCRDGPALAVTHHHDQ